MLPPLSFQEPPTALSLSAARATLQDSLKSATSLADKIRVAEASLAHIVAEAQGAIDDMLREKHLVQETISQTQVSSISLVCAPFLRRAKKRVLPVFQAYLSPIKRLPGELLRELFMWCFEGHPCCAWVLSAVCANWRHQALGIPRIWSKVSCANRRLFGGAATSGFLA